MTSGMTTGTVTCDCGWPLDAGATCDGCGYTAPAGSSHTATMPAVADGGPPHPADDPREHGRGRGGHLRAVGQHEHDGDDDGTAVLDAIPAYPVAALVGPLRDLVEWGIRDGLPAAAIGAAGLAALATVTARAELSLTSTYVVRPALWVAPVGGTGTGKSPALDQAFAAITALYDDERAQWDERARMAKEDGADVEAGPRPQPLTLGDVTLPAAARWLQDNGGTGCLVYDELSNMLGVMLGSDRAKLCEAWTARRPLHIQRVGDGGGRNAIDIYVGKPVLSVVGPLTPDNTRELGREGDGFRARWLVHLIEGRAALLDGGPQPDAWTAAIGALYGARESRRWQLAGAARTAYERARQRWETEQEQPYPQSVIEALRKADAQCARIALVLAESCESASAAVASARPNRIPADVMRAAIALTDYVMDCWKALPGGATLTLSMAEEKMAGAAEELFTWLESRPPGTEGLVEGEAPRPRATRREIARARVGGAVTADRLSAMLAAYDMRWPGNVAQVKQPGRGGTVRTFYYFPKRAANGVTGAVEAVTVTASDAHPRGNPADNTAGHDDAGGPESCHKEAVTRSCDSFPVTASTGSGAAPVACSECGEPLDAALVAAGMIDHGERG